jgi:hypothetical protein
MMPKTNERPPFPPYPVYPVFQRKRGLSGVGQMGLVVGPVCGARIKMYTATNWVLGRGTGMNVALVG